MRIESSVLNWSVSTNEGLDQYEVVSYLSQDVHDDGHHSVLPGEALVGHVPGRAAAADEDVAGGRLKGHVLHVGSHPAVGLAKHGLWPQGGGHQVDVLALDAAGGERGSK